MAKRPPPPAWRSGRSSLKRLVDDSRGVICELKVGSSEGGNKSGIDAPPGIRRHAAALRPRVIGTPPVAPTIRPHRQHCGRAHQRRRGQRMRGVLATVHLFVKPGVTEKDLWHLPSHLQRQNN
ncbi:MAG: hypothetical protein R2856_30885 [Caldilineaceae bacterium]